MCRVYLKYALIKMLLFYNKTLKTITKINNLFKTYGI